MANPGHSSKFHLPTLAIILSTFLWGTWWIPLRTLDTFSAGSIWLTGAGALLPALMFLPYMFRNRIRIMGAGRPLFICALAFGISCSLYAEGAMRGNVARVILLFYLTPVWSTLLARLFLQQPITPHRMASIAIGLCGMWVILGGKGLLPLPRDIAEWMGLIAGVAWALAMVYTQLTRGTPILDLAGPAFVAFALLFASLTLIPGGRHWQMDGLEVVPAALIWIIAIAIVWHLPSILLTLFGGAEVEPGRVAILLMLEVVIGVGSAALFAGESFGMREILGTLFVITAGFCEFAPTIFGAASKKVSKR